MDKTEKGGGNKEREKERRNEESSGPLASTYKKSCFASDHAAV